MDSDQQFGKAHTHPHAHTEAEREIEKEKRQIINISVHPFIHACIYSQFDIYH